MYFASSSILMQPRRCGCWRSALFPTSVRRLVVYSGRTPDIIYGGFLKDLAWAGEQRGEDPYFFCGCSQSTRHTDRRAALAQKESLHLHHRR